MQRWFPPSIHEIVRPASHLPDADLPGSGCARGDSSQTATSQWRGAVAALGQLLRSQSETLAPLTELSDATHPTAADPATDPVQGMILTGPVPVFTQAPWLSGWLTWTCSPQGLGTLWQLPAAGASALPSTDHHNAPQAIALLPGDPLAQEAFCLVLSAQFGAVLTLDSGDNRGDRGEGRNSFQYSFDPKVVWQAWQTLRARVAIAHPTELPRLDALAAQFVPVEPHYSVVMEFGQRLLAALPAPVAPATPARPLHRSHEITRRQHRTLSNPRDHKLDASVLAAAQRRVEPNPKPGRSGFGDRQIARSGAVGAVGADIELLQALSHGVRTPLATIRTLTRLLMRRRDMQPDALRHLEKIDRECTDQIDRFDLIFKAVELETGSNPAQSQALAPISLGQLFQTNIPRWQRQAERHNLTIDVQVPQKLPAVASDPAVLDRILTELVENLARNLPAGSHLEMQVLPAGDRLKLQLRCQRPDGETNAPVAMDYDELLAQGMSGILTGLGAAVASSVSVGQLLTFQPETGNLSLNLNVTKNLFQAIGGKLVVRQRPRQGEFATIFLPLALKL